MDSPTDAAQNVKQFLTKKSNELNSSASRNTTDYYANLLANLQLDQLTTLQNPKANETIYVVPLINNNDATKSTVAIFYKYINIEEADIVAVENGKEVTTDFKNVLTYDLNTFTGKIETKNVKGDITNVDEIVNGKVVARKVLESRMALPVGTEEPCVNYYWVDYYTNSAGQEVIVSTTFLYSDCGGLTTGGVDEEPDANAQTSWEPSSGNLTTYITYNITATETFRGNKRKFRNASVQGIGFNTVGNLSGLSFIHTVQNHTITSGGTGYNTATVIAKGNVKSGTNTYVTYDEDQTWNSNGVF